MYVPDGCTDSSSGSEFRFALNRVCMICLSDVSPLLFYFKCVRYVLLRSICFLFFPARTIKYDKLVLAVGAEPASSIDKVPGARERAIPFYSIEDSFRVKQAITKLKVR